MAGQSNVIILSPIQSNDSNLPARRKQIEVAALARAGGTQ